jgi:hypothetical protein
LKIKYIDGRRLYYAVLAGGHAVIRDRDFLNKINVFPVPDADTGTNLASTMRAIRRRASAFRSPKETLASIADAALNGARGNSGLIFAQFLVGLSLEIRNDIRLTAGQFAEAVHRAARHARQAVVNPVEGTMLTVIQDWAEAIYRERHRLEDFVELMTLSLREAERSLKDTTRRLAVLARAGVVDAGAKGFFDFIEGISHFIRKGDIKAVLETGEQDIRVETEPLESRNNLTTRYCTEALIVGERLDAAALRAMAHEVGESVVVAGTDSKLRVHVHTDRPAELFTGIERLGEIVEVKADDMRRQYEAGHARVCDTAIITDSTCDLPDELLDRHQVHMIPFLLSFGGSVFLDRMTMTSEKFYRFLESSREAPKSAQPSLEAVQRQVEFLANHYPSMIALTISDKLTGIYGQLEGLKASLKLPDFHVVNSRNISAGLGMLVLRAAQAVEAGEPAAAVAEKARQWASQTRLYVDVRTLKYMVRGGRVSRAKGLLAAALNIKPIISLDSEGKAVALGKSFSRRGNTRKILAMIEQESCGRKTWNYAVVHARNPERAAYYGEKLAGILGKPPLFINEISPVIGAHNGIGVVGICLMYE